jgi:hypothetical protein
LEGAVAQLEAELQMERSRSASLNAEKRALRAHLAGIVSRLRPGDAKAAAAVAYGEAPAPASAGYNDGAAAGAAEAAPVDLDGSIVAAAEQKLRAGAAGVLLDTWATDTSMPDPPRDSEVALAAARQQEGRDMSSSPERTASAAVTREERHDGLNMPITPVRTTEPPMKGSSVSEVGHSQAGAEQVGDSGGEPGELEVREAKRFAPAGVEDGKPTVTKRGRADSARDWTFARDVSP